MHKVLSTGKKQNVVVPLGPCAERFKISDSHAFVCLNAVSSITAIFAWSAVLVTLSLRVPTNTNGAVLPVDSS